MKSVGRKFPLKIPKNRFRWFVLCSFLFLGLVVIGNIGCDNAQEACIWDDTEWNNCNWQ